MQSINWLTARLKVRQGIHEQGESFSRRNEFQEFRHRQPNGF
jgi:hypothetical protein